MNGILYAFLGTLFTFGITALGALNVFAVKKKADHTMEALTLGFAGGVMIAASVWSLLIPGMERAKELGQTSYLVMSVGFLAGVGLLLLADKLIQKKSKRSESKSTQMLVLAITAHNIPEGMAVGLAFALAAASPDSEALFSGAVALTMESESRIIRKGRQWLCRCSEKGRQKGRHFSLEACLQL